MSSHFTYEIDERNLRVILKEAELNYDEEAWQKFELYAGTQVGNSNSGKFQNFQIPISRNVILPAVFGLMVILLATVLFKIINIKTPQKQEEVNADNKTIITFPEVKPQTDTKMPPQTPEENQNQSKNGAAIKVEAPKIPKPQNKNQLTKTTPTVEPQVNAQRKTSAAIPQTTNTVSNIQNTKTTTTFTPPPAATQTTGQVINNPPPEPIKKKRRRRSGEVIENQPVPETRPNIGTEEREPEERPN